MKIYTGGGDRGETSLVNGERISKGHLRLDCYGALDELNSFIGLLLNHLPESIDTQFLDTTQNRLFNLGSLLACPDEAMQNKMPQVTTDDIQQVESEIDRLSENLPPLKEFILPGGHISSSSAHICRTICRRAERHCSQLHETEPLPPTLIPYLNRLSDYFYTLARLCNMHTATAEVTWKK